MLRDSVRAFAQERLVPVAAEIDRTEKMPVDTLREMASPPPRRASSARSDERGRGGPGGGVYVDEGGGGGRGRADGGVA